MIKPANKRKDDAVQVAYSVMQDDHVWSLVEIVSLID